MQIHRAARHATSVASSIAIASAALLTLAACGSEADNSADVATSSSVETAAPPVASAQITEGTGTFGSAKSAVCEVDFQTMSVAIEAYYALNGAYPVAESDLVTESLLRGESPLYDIVDGNVLVPSPAGGCTG